ncbi:hypothetical protein B0T10DRAFT_502311 [Thelonectria olida]|uniref:Uncharacterized protein n=1 Tax=Thelonectria olida TaxID=1576542 RepID=A0A9P8VMR3_9HYPO|nr:hypothetical protein B0T10DRAFT_502311 [Thelonectria olida]
MRHGDSSLLQGLALPGSLVWLTLYTSAVAALAGRVAGALNLFCVTAEACSERRAGHWWRWGPRRREMNESAALTGILEIESGDWARRKY